ncbi:MAG: endonuclease/exonuclease/phosphatase family protein [Myxococcales bacterium]|nr:endonuclease/exonuclease/phosphatase family protein [Myxococcales bacterium]
MGTRDPLGRIDPDHQVRATTPTRLERPLRAAALPPEVIAAVAACKRRRDLWRSPVYQRHRDALLELTYAMEHEPTPASSKPLDRPFIRTVAWNIQRGMRLDDIKRLLDTHEALRDTDVLLLNEVDIGMARSGNRNIARELAEHLGFGYVFGNSYLCLSYGDARDVQQSAEARGGENRESMHGNAIISRFPFVHAENISVAISRDKLSSSEPRLGHKKALWAELDTPRGPLHVCATHLDAYASLAQRGEQMRDVLSLLRARRIDQRALLGGDMNTNTYDVDTVWRLLGNFARKMVRGGFPHAIEHYLKPHEIYERPVFDALEQHGFEYAPFNDMSTGTSRYEVGSEGDESVIRELLPRFAVWILAYKLRPWDGVAQLKVDWFFGRGLRANAPQTLTRASVDGREVSDHDPIVVDVSF